MFVDQTLRKARGLTQKGDKTAAEQLYRAVLDRYPGNRKAAAELQSLLSPIIENPPETELDQLVALYDQRRLAEALERAAQLLARYPHGEVLHNLTGVFNAGIGRLDDAIAHYDQAIALAPDYFEALNNRGNALVKQKRLEQALASFDAAVGIAPDYAEAHLNRAVALGKLQRPDDALAAYAKTLHLHPGCAEAYNNRGNLLITQHRLRDALADYDEAVRLRPSYADALLNRGNALVLLGEPEAALTSYDQAIALAPALAQAHNDRGVALRALKRPEEALASHRHALRIRPDYALAYGEVLHLEAHMCRWPDRPCDQDLLDRGIADEAIPPFYMFGLADDPQRQLAFARAWARHKFGGIRPGAFPRPGPGTKIRIGYFSADFHNHATMYLMARLFELHDRHAFEIHAFSYGQAAGDEMRLRLRDAVEAFHDVADLDDRAVAALSAERGIDVAVDLKGYTAGGRPGIFAHRAAPVQVSYLGYPGTMGADFIDYMIADGVTIPDALRPCYAEQIIHLPHSYQVNDDQRPIAETPVTRGEFGLPADGFVFCCFNNNYKITSAEFDVWMRLLHRVDGSVLWLLRDNEMAAASLRQEAERRGICSSRLVFADRAPLPEHLARHRCADLFLDTFNINAHTTASDALWAGLPVLTKAGRSFVARVAASLLHAHGLPELVAETVEDYERLALDLATDPTRLAAVKRKVAAHRATAPLFDSARTTRDLEAVYRQLVAEARSA